ncbi:MAG: CocE/NonD family hydrolase [Rhodospirillales bacterium]|nr:CocE/NonD family hydrolase [Rhodospirillales bacterium]
MKRIVERFSNAVRDIENIWIPLSDGTRLATRIWMPDDAEKSPVPAILEYIPYRKRESTRCRDEPMHRYFAGHGYACLRVDIRGAGDSEGELNDEYLQVHELDDALEVIAWIATQPWCDGNVGMMGKSWGGFNALQTAALQPEALKTIIAVCATDDRYADDVHYMGGCLLDANQMWSATMMLFNNRPPDPEIVGDRWLDMWKERLDRDQPWAFEWLRHPRRDAYWKHGSVCEDYAAIKVPVYTIAGWADAYTNAIPRLMAGLDVPRRGIIGPWAHVYPQDGAPGPAIGFLQDALRWWDRWLKGIENGIENEPNYRVWMQESVRPATDYGERPGRWVAEDTWPSAQIEPRTLHLNGDRSLADKMRRRGPIVFCSPASTGLDGGEWCAFGMAAELAGDQQADDGKSVCFDSEPLSDRVEVLGQPVAVLKIASDKPVAQVAVRLNDIAPDGASTRVTYGALNLTHRDSHERPRKLKPGKTYTVRVALNDIAHAFPAGHRIRVAISSCYWPMIWPAPEAATLTLQAGSSLFELPVRAPRASDDDLPAFEEPETAPDVPISQVSDGHFHRWIERSLITGEISSHVDADGGFFGNEGTIRIDPIDTEVSHQLRRRSTIHDGDPLCASSHHEQSTTLKRGDWEVRVDIRSHQWSTAEHIHHEAEVDAFHGDRKISSRRWSRGFRRDLL